MTLIDSHCHLDNEQFNADREAVIARALEAGVETMVAIGTAWTMVRRLLLVVTL